MPEFIKKLFGDKTLSYDEFKKIYDEQESGADGVKLANLKEGKYVDIEKLKTAETAKTTAETAKKTAEEALKTLQESVKEFDGVDLKALKNAATTAQKKYDEDLATVRRDSALDLLLTQAGARNVRAARALIDLSKVKLKEDGSVDGVDIEGLKKSDAYLFTVETKTNIGDGHDGGSAGGDGDTPTTLGSEIMSAMYGSPPAAK